MGSYVYEVGRQVMRCIWEEMGSVGVCICVAALFFFARPEDCLEVIPELVMGWGKQEPETCLISRVHLIRDAFYRPRPANATAAVANHSSCLLV